MKKKPDKKRNEKNKQKPKQERLIPPSRLGFFAWIVPPPFLNVVENLKKAIFKKFNVKQTLKAPAHLTFIPPLLLSLHQIKKAIAALEEFNQSLTTPNLEILDVGHFKDKTIFLKTTNLAELNEIRQALNDLIAKRLNLTIKPSHHKFIPHISVANRDIPPASFQSLYIFIRNKNLNFHAPLSKIDLLIWSGNKWSSPRQIADLE